MPSRNIMVKKRMTLILKQNNARETSLSEILLLIYFLKITALRKYNRKRENFHNISYMQKGFKEHKERLI